MARGIRGSRTPGSVMAIFAVTLMTPLPVFGVKGVQVAKLTVPTSCDTSARIKVRKSVDKSNRDVLVWRIDNKCGKPIVASFLTDSKAFTCFGVPPEAKMGKTGAEVPFAMNAGDRFFVVCQVAYPSADDFEPVEHAFSFGFSIGEPPQQGSMVESVPATNIVIITSEIAIEVEP